MQTFLINLDSRPDRLEQFRRANAHMENIVRFPAVDGGAIDRRKLVEMNIFAPDVNYTPEAVGRALSHLRLWNEAMQRKEAVTAMEDGAIAHRDFAGMSEKIVAGLPPDWDIVVWGWDPGAPFLFDMLPEISPALLKSFGGRKMDNKFQTLPVSPQVYRLSVCFGAVCYSVSPQGASKLTALAVPVKNFTLPIPGEANPVRNTGIDAVMASLYGRLNAYVSLPPLTLKNDTAVSAEQPHKQSIPA